MAAAVWSGCSPASGLGRLSASRLVRGSSPSHQNVKRPPFKGVLLEYSSPQPLRFWGGSRIFWTPPLSQALWGHRTPPAPHPLLPSLAPSVRDTRRLLQTLVPGGSAVA